MSARKSLPRNSANRLPHNIRAAQCTMNKVLIQSRNLPKKISFFDQNLAARRERDERHAVNQQYRRSPATRCPLVDGWLRVRAPPFRLRNLRMMLKSLNGNQLMHKSRTDGSADATEGGRAAGRRKEGRNLISHDHVSTTFAVDDFET